MCSQSWSQRGGGQNSHILPYQKVSFCYDKLVKLIAITRFCRFFQQFALRVARREDILIN